MIYRVETMLRQLKRLYSRNRFVVWLFGMSKSIGDGNQPGLIILQIDGLSLSELKRALATRSMPFTKRLLEQEHYTLHSLYSGIPSSTPAAQGELFYGVKGCVPAFRFKRPEDKRPMAMLEPELALAVQGSLEGGDEPLLKEGSAFSDMFDGGAQEASFCASSLGWSNLIPTHNFPKMAIFLLLNIFSLLRVLVLTLIEFFLAVIDFTRGVFSGQNIIKELGFVPVRLVTAVVLRELVTIGIKLDAARGVPIIHGNFLSYDEQAHRRGPDSKFAHWSLKGLDNAIARIWKAAQQSECREYDIWIYSDHGQEKTRSYPTEYNRSIDSAIEQVLSNYADLGALKKSVTQSDETNFILDDQHSGRAHLLGIKKLSAWLSRLGSDESTPKLDFTLAAMGPLGFVYVDSGFNIETQRSIAKDLVKLAKVPMVAAVTKEALDGISVLIWRQDGEFTLPLDKDTIFGADHPFLEEVCEDFIALCHHKYSGQFVISGWTPKTQAMSFRIENGSHAGPGPNETSAFALIPEDTTINNGEKNYLRFTDLYLSALHHLGRKPYQQSKQGTSAPQAPQARNDHSLRVMTYNVHSCIGMDGSVSPRRIARVIARYDPDVVALQELDTNMTSAIMLDQASTIAAELDMEFYFHPVRASLNGEFGNAILSKYPIKLIQLSALSRLSKPRKLQISTLSQPRGRMEVEINVNGTRLRLVNTHFGLTPEERKVQVRDLFTNAGQDGDETGLAATGSTKIVPTILCGDFNSTPKQYAYKEICRVMHDVEKALAHKAKARMSKKTFPSRYPTVRLDHIFIDEKIKVKSIVVPENQLTKVASDHLPLIADLDISDL
jgi:endonuclease/exonuclease/phosphatase family metal-dependent hydrolase